MCQMHITHIYVFPFHAHTNTPKTPNHTHTLTHTCLYICADHNINTQKYTEIVHTHTRTNTYLYFAHSQIQFLSLEQG